MSESAPSNSAASRRAVWRKRIRRTVYILLGIAVIFRIILFFALGPVLSKVAASYGFTATYDRQELTLLAGDVGLWGLKISPTAGGPPLFSADYIRGNIAPLALLEGRLYVRRAEVDGSEIVLDRTPDGRIPLLEHLVSSTPAPTAQPAAQQSPLSLDFTPSLAVEAFRLSHVRAKVMDESVQPPFESTVAMDLRVSNFGMRGQPTYFEIDSWSDPALDLLRISGKSLADGQTLHATATLTMRGLHPRPLAGYLLPLGIRPVGSNLTGDLYADLVIQPATKPDVGMSLALTLNNIGLWSDEQSSFSVSNFALTANAASPQKILLNSVEVDGVRVNVTRDPASGIQFGGFAVGSAPPTTRPTTEPASVASVPTSSSSPSPFGLDLRWFAINDVDFAFRDSAVSPPNELHFLIPQLSAKADDSSGTIPITGSISLPGIIGNINFSGVANGAKRDMTLSMRAQHIRPDGISPYLAANNLESLWSDGNFAADMSADLRTDTQGDLVADAACGPITLGDGSNLFTFKNLALRGAGLDSQSGRFKIESLELTGPDLQISRDADGRVTVANFRWTPTPVPAPPAEESTESSTLLGSFALPRIEIGRFLWHDPNISFHDEYSQPKADLTLTNAGIDIKNFRFDLDADGPAEDGTISAWLGPLAVTGKTHSARDLFHADLSVRGRGMQLTDLAPLGRTIGFEPTIQNGSFQLDASAQVSRNNSPATASVDIQNVSLRDGSTELAGLDSIHIAGVHVDPAGDDILTAAIANPRISAGRDADRILRIAGIRIIPSDQPQPSSGNFNFPQAIGLGDFRVTNAKILWNDLATPKPVSAVIQTDVQLQGMKRDLSAPAATYQIKTKIDGTLDDFSIFGTLDAHPDHPRLTAQLTASGLRGGIIPAYLPSGDKWALLAGQLKVALEAEAPVNPAGGRSVNINLHDLDWRDGPGGAPIFSITSAKFIASRFDPRGGVIAIDQISLDGLKTEAQLDTDGNLHSMGLTLGNTPGQNPPTTQPVARPTRRPATAPADLAKLIAKPGQTVPHITIQNFDINLDRIAMRNLAQPNAVPLALEHIRLHNPQLIDLGGATPYSTPIALQLTGAVTPVVGQFTVNFTATPLQQQPVLTADLAVTGIRGQGVTDIAPQLSSMLDGSGMTDGRIAASSKLTLDFTRRGPTDFNVSRGIKVNGYVRSIDMRDSPNGPVLAGLSGIYLQDGLIRPTTGVTLFKTVTIQTPQAYIYRDAGGVHVCGFAIRPAPVGAPPKTPAPKTPQKKPPARAPATAAAADPPAPIASAPPPPSGELRIDNLLVGGLDVRIEDRLAQPPFVAPLTGLDVEVRDLTTRAFTEPKVIRFSALLSAGKVPIYSPKSPTTRPIEQRTLFSQALASGRFSLYPQPDGYIKLALNGLELAALQGVAAEFGAQLRGGVFDADVDLRPHGSDSIDTDCKFVFTDLQISDGSNGAISKFLKLPAPLDTVIFALQAPDGSITIPISFTIKNGQISQSAIVAGAMGATGPIVATAVASAPLKLAGGALGIFGIGGQKGAPHTETYEVDFAPGSADLDSAGLTLVQSFLLLAHRNPDLQFTIRQELGTHDIQLASQRANPDEADAMAMIEQLRQRRTDLFIERARLAGLLRGQLAAVSTADVDQSIAQLRQIERQLADVENACNELYDLLRPGSSRLAGRRTRGAAMDIAQRRLDVVDGYFQRSLSSYSQRVRVVAPQYTPAATPSGRVLITVIAGK